MNASLITSLDKHRDDNDIMGCGASTPAAVDIPPSKEIDTVTRGNDAGKPSGLTVSLVWY